ncbi:MAG: hypothetical protein JSU98_11545 [Gemmatimonadales bacterium]|jgi:hypothetical protein|nr:MAG: hypothetical protein JSU98_11545 [Gemmatimonadales bacterium]
MGLPLAGLLVVLAAQPVSGIQVTTQLAPASLGARCAAEAIPSSRMRVLQRALADPRDPAVAPPVIALYDSLLVEAQARPGDLELTFLLAVATGTRGEMSSGRTQLAWAERMHELVQVLLESQPGHPGAEHLLGRLHAGVLRMGSLRRWVARALFGGEILAMASWDEAQVLLQEAARKAPCMPDHHYELAALYRDTGRPELARQEALHALEVSSLDDAYEGVARKARVLLGVEDGAGRRESDAPRSTW